MNILLIIVLVLLFCNVVNGFHRGMVKAVISFVSLIVLSIFVVLAGNGLRSYLRGEFLNVAVVVLLLGVLGILHHLLGVVVLPAKLVSKLPVVHAGDKLLGIVVGILQTVLILWTVYTLGMVLNLGEIGSKILDYTYESSVLTWFYENNYLANVVEMLGAKLSDLSIDAIL